MTTQTNGRTTASVEVLTAEVRALMVGSRQVTLSVYRQLDEVPHDEIIPFGRVRDAKDEPGEPIAVHVVGKHIHTNALVVSYRTSVDNHVTFEAPLTRWWREADHFGDPQPVYHRETNSLQKAMILSRGDRAIYWYLFTPEERVQYNTHRVYKWGYRDPQTQEQAIQWAEKTLNEMQHMQQLHAEWLTLPLIVLAGLR